MADKVVLEAEVKSNIGDVAKDAKSAAGEFQVMGVSLNSIRAGFVSVAAKAKLAFGSIKAGLISTGIGALVVAIGSLVTWFNKTKEGAELLERGFKAFGAAVNVVTGRVAEFGKGLAMLVTGKPIQGLKTMLGAFKDIGVEIKNDITETVELTRQQQKLADSERDLRVETARRRAEIEKLKMTAEDTTKSERARLIAAQDAFDIENKLLNDRIANAQTALRLQQQQMELNKIDGKNTEADLELEAQLQIRIADIKAESTTKQIELNNKLNAINAEIRNGEKSSFDQRMNEMEAIPRAGEEMNETLFKSNDTLFKQDLANDKKRSESAEANKDATLAAASSLSGSLSSLAGDNKELAAAGALIDTYAGANKAFAQGGVAGFATGAAIIAAGLVNLQKIYATDVPGSGGGAGGGAAAAQTPAPQMMSGAFTLGGGQAPAPVQAFVVTDEMTNSQNQLANIRRRSSL